MKAIVDCNSFYCSCEQLFRPDLRNRPVVVLSNNDGCIVSRSDEAKAEGIGMAAPYYQYRDLIEKRNIAAFSSNYNLYGDLSRRVMDTLRELVGNDKVEVYSVDEAFIDMDIIPEDQLLFAAKEIRQKVEEWTGIKVSIGVAQTKVLCKLANRMAKEDKNGTDCVMVLNDEVKIREALEQTPVGSLWGVGRRYGDKLINHYGIKTAWHLRNMNEEWARKYLGGVVGVRLIKELKGEPCIEMRDPLEKKDMIATTRMFGSPVTELTPLKEAVATYTSRAAEKLRRQHCAAKKLQVFVVTNNYGENYEYRPKTNYREILLPRATAMTNDLIHFAIPLVEEPFSAGSRYLKAGVVLSHIVPDDSIQGNLFVPSKENTQRFLMDAMDNINFSMRDDVVKYASSGLTRNWKMRQELRSQRYTTRWDELYTIS